MEMRFPNNGVSWNRFHHPSYSSPAAADSVVDREKQFSEPSANLLGARSATLFFPLRRTQYQGK